MKLIWPAILLILAVAIAPAGLITTITYTGNSGVYSHGEAIGPYYAIIGGIPMTVVCDDYNHSIHVGQTWSAQELTWTSLSPGNKADYRAAFWLVGLVLDQGPDQVGAQWALWHLFDDHAPLYVTAGTLLSWARSQTELPAGDFTVYQPLNLRECGPQEFIGRLETPEPLTAGLVCFGLAGIILYFRKQREKG